MGNSIGSLADKFVSHAGNVIEEKQREAFKLQQLAQIKSLKRQRDFEIANKIALCRDRVWWMTAFYITMGTVSIGRMIHLRQFAPLPLSFVPYVLVPYLVGYQADLAYGNKAERINKMVQKIIHEEEGHWFNEPMEIPELLKCTYYKAMEENNKQLIAAGKPPDKHWGK